MQPLLPWLLAAAAALNSVQGWVRADATGEANNRNEIERRHEFEVNVDKRLVELRDRMDVADKDREARYNALWAKLDELNARFNHRIELRNEQASEQNQRTSALELKVCMLAGRKLAECK